MLLSCVLLCHRASIHLGAQLLMQLPQVLMPALFHFTLTLHHGEHGQRQVPAQGGVMSLERRSRRARGGVEQSQVTVGPSGRRTPAASRRFRFLRPRAVLEAHFAKFLTCRETLGGTSCEQRAQFARLRMRFAPGVGDRILGIDVGELIEDFDQLLA